MSLDSSTVTRWSGEGIRSFSAPLETLLDLLPTFSRAPLCVDLRPMSAARGSLPPILGGRRGVPAHRYLDAILVNPEWPAQRPVPIALVSKGYSLVQHRELVASLSRAIGKHIKGAPSLPCAVVLSEYGGRMKLRVTLPTDFKPPDGEPIVPTIECLNSVDRSRPLQVYLGWFRFICFNGLIVGEEFARLRKRHVRSLELADVQEAVSQQISRLARDAEVLKTWGATAVSDEALRAWVDGSLAKEWGLHAAARVWHISRTGFDCRVRPSDQQVPASHRRVERGGAVPGSKAPNGTAYRISQVLAFVAGQGAELEAVQQRLADIPALMRALLSEAPEAPVVRASSVRRVGRPNRRRVS